jgi:uncharacterized protein (TIGR00369 family)
LAIPRIVDVETANAVGRGFLPDLIGLRFTEFRKGHVVAELTIPPHRLAPNGFLHAATVIALADTAAGYGCVGALPDGASGFTTIELQSKFLGTALEGTIRTVATMRHGGRSLQHWDAEVFDAGGRTIALFRCTQLVLWPR